ncbi:MAG: Maf family protein, partial [Bacilli bacterium]
MVFFQNQQLGKPKNHDEALKMLQMLSGNTHEIVTAYCIQKGSTILKTRVCSSILFIEKMADMEIEEYIDTGSPFDKAGGYGVQDKDFITSKIVKGDVYTIMGLPKEQLEEDLFELGILE